MEEPTREEPQQPRREVERQMVDTQLLESELRRARDEAAESRKTLKEVEKERDAVLKKLESVELKVKAKDDEILSVKSQLEEATGSVDTWKEKYEAQEKAISDELLSRIPEERREKYTGFTVDQLRTVVEDVSSTQTTTKAQSVETGKAGEAITADQHDLNSLSLNDLENLRSTNPTIYDELISKSMNMGNQPYGL